MKSNFIANTAWTYKEYAGFMEISRRMLIDKVLELKEQGIITEAIANEILSSGKNFFIQKYPHLLPTT